MHLTVLVLSITAGKDHLQAGDGFDMLASGVGEDLLLAGKGDDRLITGSPTNRNDTSALDAALAEWTAHDLSRALVDLGAITNDGDKDDVKGNANGDELLGGASDKLKP